MKKNRLTLTRHKHIYCNSNCSHILIASKAPFQFLYIYIDGSVPKFQKDCLFPQNHYNLIAGKAKMKREKEKTKNWELPRKLAPFLNSHLDLQFGA